MSNSGYFNNESVSRTVTISRFNRRRFFCPSRQIMAFAAAILMSSVMAFTTRPIATVKSRSAGHAITAASTTMSAIRHTTRTTMMTRYCNDEQLPSFRQRQQQRHRKKRPLTLLEGVQRDTTDATAMSFDGSTAKAGTNSSSTTDDAAFQVAYADGSGELDSYSYRGAIKRTLGWVFAAIVFGGFVWSMYGSEIGEEFFAGYLVEQSLSVDNLFVFLLLFEYFKIPLQYQDRILNWGIYGAIIMRGIMIFLGSAALHQYKEILLVFASILVYSSLKYFIGDDEDGEEDPGENSIVKFARGLLRSTDRFDGDRFFTFIKGVRVATPMFICMIAVEISDVVFAVDSIPAVFGVTEEPLVVFSSNLFAIMGLRSLYTILSKAATDLEYLEPAVAVVLGFIGLKMILEYFGMVLPTSIALAVVASLLGFGIGASVLEKQRNLETTSTSSQSSSSSSTP